MVKNILSSTSSFDIRNNFIKELALLFKINSRLILVHHRYLKSYL